MNSRALQPRPRAWAVVLALALVYVCWGTTFLAIGAGVKEFPPALFGGTRILLAGLLLFGYLTLRGNRPSLPLRELLWIAIAGLAMAVGGNWLLSLAQKTVPSGEASLLVATMPLWMVLLERACPWGDRLNWKGWLGLGAGLAGVFVLMNRRVNAANILTDAGPLLVLASAFFWAVGSVILRRRIKNGSPLLVGAAWQMVLGGGMATLLGLGLGEFAQITPEKFTFTAVWAYLHLLVIGALVAFLTYLWLLDRVSAALAGTHAYVSPVIAVFLGCWLANEQLTLPMLVGMVIVLASVALVQAGVVHSNEKGKPAAPPSLGKRSLEPLPSDCSCPPATPANRRLGGFLSWSRISQVGQT